jgi:hypothetical protein
MAAVGLRRAAIALIVGLLAGWPQAWAAEANPPRQAEEDADGSRFVWLVLKRSGMEFDYLSADHFAESPKFRPIEHGMQDTGDVAWWPHFMAIYDPNFPRARELPADVAIITAQGPRSLAKLEEDLGPAVFYRYRK